MWRLHAQSREGADGPSGVTSARANLSARRVTAVHGTRGDNAADLVDALARAGFKAAELAEGTAGPAKPADRELLKRLGVAGFAAANIMLLSVSVWSGTAGDMTPSVQTLFHWLSALIALPTVAYAGQPFFRSAAQALRARRLNMDVPISLGVTLATGMSLYQTARGSEQVYFDAAVTLLFFLLVGRFLDQHMRQRTAGAAANLMGLRGATAMIICSDGTTERLGARLLEPGMRILTAAGERFAVDGRVLDGRGEVDESLITGETAPRRVVPGAQIYAGTVNLSGSLVTEATATDQNTVLAEIARLMSAAEQARGRYVRLADRAAGFYAPAVHILGLVTFLGWLLVGQGWETALTVAIAVLIITCPCALALAVPAVQVAATGRLFGKGVLVKASDGLERLAEVDTVVFDKTGTLTLGEPVLEKSEDVSGVVLARAASLAAASRHPYARAVVRAAETAGLEIATPADVREVAGFGLEREGPDGTERLGSGDWCGIETPGSDAAAMWYRGADGTMTAFSFADRLRSDANDVVRRLREAGFHTELLSGDRRNVVEAAAIQAGIGRWTAGVRPAQKIVRIEELEAGRTQSADGRRRPQRCARTGRRACLAFARDGGGHQPDGRRCRLPGRVSSARAGSAGRWPDHAPDGFAELRHRHRLQRGVRAAGDGGACHAAYRGHRHVGIVHCGDNQRRQAQNHAAGRGSMTALVWLIPCALALGLLGLAAFLWSLKNGQFEDLEGASWRALEDDETRKQ